MRKHYCKTGEKDSEPHAEHISEFTTRLLERVIVMSNEVEEKLNQIVICPEHCNDGMVEISISSGETRKVPCPLIALDCPYGRWMQQELNRYVTGIMSKIGVPRRHLENFMETFQMEALAGIDKWPVRGFLIFTGNTGSGKSFGAALTIRKYLKSLITNNFDRMTWETAERAASSVLWCAAVDISDDRETAVRAKRKYLAVIDDLGGEADTPIGQAAMRSVIMKRHDMKLPTVITTTLTMPGIDIRYGSCVIDRLTEDIGNGSMIIECGNVSKRNNTVSFPADRRE